MYIAPTNEDKPCVQVGKITEKETSSAERSVDPEFENSDEITSTRIVARLIKITEDILHCHIIEDISAEDVNKFTNEASILAIPGFVWS